jgi:HK97 family phage major capsid protein
MEPKKVEVTLPPELAKRYTEATTDEQRHEVMQEFARSRGAETDITKKEAMYMSDDQFRAFLSKVGDASAAQAKEAIAAVSAGVERKYNLDGEEANRIVQRSFDSAQQKHANQRRDWEMAAKVFRGIYLGSQGKPDAYRRAIEEEAEYTRKTYGRETRAMSLATDSTGGYLAPQQFSDQLYENISRQSHVRKFATIIQMNGNEVIKIPMLTSSLTANVVAEATAIPSSEPVFTQKQLDTQKIATRSTPISVEPIEKANPAIVPLVIKFATIEIMKKEDEMVFGTTGDGIRASSVNEVTGQAAAGGYAAVTFDDFANLINQLDPEYTPDEDIGGGDFTGVARFWLPHKLRGSLMVKKDSTSVYLDEARELRNSRQIFGFDAKRVLTLPTAPVTGQKYAIFGDLSYVWCGVEPGFRIKILEEGTVDGVSLADTAQVSVRVLEFFDNVVIDNKAFSQLKAA